MQQNNVLSTNDILTWVIKIFGVIGMIFIGITLIIPWGSFNLGAGFGVSMYPWGVFSSEGVAAAAGGGAPLLNDWFYINIMQSGIDGGLLAGVFMILVFIFAIITLIIGLKAFRSIGTGVLNKNFLIAGIFGIVTLVMCGIAIMQANTFGTIAFSIFSGGGAILGGFGYTWGFILMLITVIFFFINYGLDYFILHSGMGLQQPVGGQQQPQVMYTSQQPPPQQPIQQQPPVQQTPPPPVTPQEQPPQKEAKPSFCNNCGAQLQAGVKFCNECGAKI